MKKIAILIISYLVLNTGTTAQVTQVWSADFQKIQGGLIEPVDLVVDNNGDIYVAAKSPKSLMEFHPDYSIIKYSAAGEQLWEQSYDGPKKYSDVPTGITLGPNGNIYVTGQSWGLDRAGQDFCTIKYSPQGEQLWVARHDGPQGNDNHVFDLLVDQNSNIYVTGSSAHEVSSNSGFDFYTIKYDRYGKKLWALPYDRKVSTDEAKALTLDYQGNLIVTGQSNGPAFDLTTIKYQGQEKSWVAHYQGPSKTDVSSSAGVDGLAEASGVATGPGQDIPNVVKTDNQGNIYVAGYSQGKSGGRDYIVIKYDPSGNEQWVQRYNGPGDNWDEVEHMALDSQGNIIVVGFSGNNDRRKTYAYCTVKYSPQGEQLWVQRTEGKRPDVAHYKMPDMVLDRDDNIYVTGGDLLGKFYTVKYDSQGNQVWDITSGYLGGGSFAIGLDPENNIIVSGFTVRPDAGMYLLTIKYTQ